MSGSGIGLSLVKLVIERSGGEIFFDPSVSEGARCIVRLPVIEVLSDAIELGD